MKPGFVYIMANRVNGTIYTGVTSKLIQRVTQHRQGLSPGFARKYGCKLLVWFEAHHDLQEASCVSFRSRSGNVSGSSS